MSMRMLSVLRVTLHGVLAVWMAAVAVAPLWHTAHAAPPIPESVPGHDHAVGAWMCDVSPETLEPAVDCVLCKAQRQLSQYWTRTPGTTATSLTATHQSLPSLFVPCAGEQIPLAARAPPLC